MRAASELVVAACITSMLLQRQLESEATCTIACVCAYIVFVAKQASGRRADQGRVLACAYRVFSNDWPVVRLFVVQAPRRVDQSLSVRQACCSLADMTLAAATLCGHPALVGGH
jgi:hypothetical protein